MRHWLWLLIFVAGCHPSEAPVQTGMTLAPRHVTTMILDVSLPPGLLEGICLRDGGAPAQCEQYR